MADSIISLETPLGYSLSTLPEPLGCAPAACLTTLLSNASVKAENPRHVRRLLETNRYTECALSFASLQGADLQDFRSAQISE